MAGLVVEMVIAPYLGSAGRMRFVTFLQYISFVVAALLVHRAPLFQLALRILRPGVVRAVPKEMVKAAGNGK